MKSLKDNQYWLRAIGAVTVIALLAGVGLALASMDGTPSVEAKLQAAASPTAIGLPSPAECEIPPRAVDEAMAIIGPAIGNYALLETPEPTDTTRSGVSIIEDGSVSVEVAGTPWVVDGALLDVEVGAPPQPDVERAVRDTIRQYAACRNAGDTARQIALFSDRYLARRVIFSDMDAEAWRTSLETTPQPLPDDGGEIGDISPQCPPTPRWTGRGNRCHCPSVAAF